MPLPLEGIRVVDFSRVLAGRRHCAKTLLDLGAEVIKIEPPAGDRPGGPFPTPTRISGYYAQQNAGKRNVSIDLNVPGARDVLTRLCETADIIVENFRPGALAAFGLTTSRSRPATRGSSTPRSAARPARPVALADGVRAHVQAETRHHGHHGRAFPRDRQNSQRLALACRRLLPACTRPSPSWPAYRAERTGRASTSTWRWRPSWFRSTSRPRRPVRQRTRDERPILGATDAPFFEGPQGEPSPAP